MKLVDATLRGLADRPFVVLALARPEIADRFPRLWAARGPVELRLGELPRRATLQLVREVLGAAVAEDVVARVVERAAGNALYLEELLRAEVSGSDDALPDTVLAMVQARLAGFAAESRRALRAASVFGLEFGLAGTAALLGAPAEELASDLDELCEREVISRRGYGHGEARFSFGHALFREAAYASLTPADRALGHRMAAAWLLSVGERDALVLAEHYERGEQLAEAARWYRHAAEQAYRAGDMATALQRSERGIACGAAGEDLGALRCVQAEVHEWRSERAAGEVRALEAIELLPEGSTLWLRAVWALITIQSRAGRFDEVSAHVARLRDLAPEGRDAAEALGFALLAAAGQLLLAGRADQADPVLDHVRARLAPLAGDAPLLAARLEHARGMRRMYDGDLGETLEAFSSSSALSAAVGDRRGALMERCNAALVLLELGEDEEGERRVRAVMAEADSIGLESQGLFARNLLVRALRQRGALAEARALAERAIAELATHGTPGREGALRQSLAETLALAGDHEGALREMEAARALLGAFGALHVEALGAHADLLLRVGRVAEAAAMAREGVRHIEAGGGMAEGESRLRLVLVLALDALGEVEASRAALEAATASLLARAARIRDPHLRRSFLERVPENARILALASERLGVVLPPSLGDTHAPGGV